MNPGASLGLSFVAAAASANRAVAQTRHPTHAARLHPVIGRAPPRRAAETVGTRDESLTTPAETIIEGERTPSVRDDSASNGDAELGVAVNGASDAASTAAVAAPSSLRADWRGAQSTANPGLTQSLRESAKSPIDKRGGGGGYLTGL